MNTDSIDNKNSTSSEETTQHYTGISGILRPFRKFIEEYKLSAGDQVVFYGCPGTCLPIVELLVYAIRTLPLEYVFVPYLNEEKAVKLSLRDDYGMQCASAIQKIAPKVIVLMGGLSMKSSNIPAENALEIVNQHNSKVIGVCFMNFLENEGWTAKIPFNHLINAEIEKISIK